MQDPFLIFVRVLFTCAFLVVAAVGVYLARNDQRLFGRDRSMPSENSSSRTYSRLQAWSVWTHALLLTAAFALLIH